MWKLNFGAKIQTESPPRRESGKGRVDNLIRPILRVSAGKVGFVLGARLELAAFVARGDAEQVAVAFAEVRCGDEAAGESDVDDRFAGLQ
jgi:hypothetical protein